MNDELDEYAGEFNVSDYVVYFNRGNTETLGRQKKKIWKVLGINDDNDWGDEDRADAECFIQSITNPNVRFKAERYELIDAEILDKLDELTRKNINSKSLDTYNNLKNGTRDKTEKQVKMTNSGSNKIIDSNVEAAKAAGKITAGKALNKVLLKKVRPHLPLMARGYADHVLADVVVANIASFAVSNFATQNKKAAYAVEAMMQAAMVEFLATFNIEEIISEVLSTTDVELPDTGSTNG